MSNTIRLILITAVAVVMIGCGTVPVHNVNNAPVMTATENYSVEDMQRAIFRAGTSKGWQMQNVGDRRISGRIAVRDATAEVEIDYSRSSYSIRYRDSSNLKYESGNIRSGYNRWVRHLDQQIKTELSGL